MLSFWSVVFMTGPDRTIPQGWFTPDQYTPARSRSMRAGTPAHTVPTAHRHATTH